MNPLDARAQRASTAIQDSLAAAAPPASFAAVVRRALMVKVLNVALVGAGAVVFIAAGSAFRSPHPKIPVANTVVTSTTDAPVTTEPGESPRESTTTVLALPPTTDKPPSTTEAAPTTSTTTTSTTTTTTKPPPPTTTKPPDTEPPVLAILFPENRHRFTEKTVAFEGTTEPGAKVMAGDAVAAVDAKGNWRLRVRLVPGRQRIVVTAEDAAGNRARAAVVVFYAVADRAEFVAKATFGSCDSSPPYDVYHGSGEPGSSVAITSKYGSGETIVNDGGGWEIKVFFPEAPYGEAFLVKAQDEFGRSKTFEFVSYAGGI